MAKGRERHITWVGKTAACPRVARQAAMLPTRLFYNYFREPTNVAGEEGLAWAVPWPHGPGE